MSQPAIGARVKVPFGRNTMIGLVLALHNKTEVPLHKLREVYACLDEEPLLPAEMMKLLLWASRYYVHPIGEVVAAAMPVQWRRDVPAVQHTESTYRIKPGVTLVDVSARAKLQRVLFVDIEQAGPAGVCAEQLQQLSKGWRAAVSSMIDNALLESAEEKLLPLVNLPSIEPPTLNHEQLEAVRQVADKLDVFQPFLLNGVTGSGKTEVYLHLIQQVVDTKKQVLVLVPEIGLTPQLIHRFRQRLRGSFLILHSGLSASVRASHWLSALHGEVDVILGTRSAVFTPMPRLGLVIIDEEHDASLKQQDGFRYQARDLALVRARNLGIPVVLGSATPSLESLHNVDQKKFVELLLNERAGGAQPPVIALLDTRRRKIVEGLSERLLEEVKKNWQQKGQALVFLNRRGFAPVMLCTDCGAASDCLRCDAHMTVHAATNRLRCHHCGAERPVPKQCDECGSVDFDKVGQGTERIENVMKEQFPDCRVIRIDRDTTRRKGELEKYLAQATRGDADILIGTQMLAKGHHFPDVTLVGILDADRGLFGTDFRALEQMGQLIIQVAGRAGREAKKGKVLVQTRNPEHALLRLLISDGYAVFARAALTERREALLPPYSFVALIRAQAPEQARPSEFLSYVAAMIKELAPQIGIDSASLWVLGPVIAPMEKLAGRYRSQLMLQADSRKKLNDVLCRIRPYLETDSRARKVRWSIDVDPMDFL